MSQNLFKNILFDQISMCCWPRILAQIDPNRSFFTLVPPPCGQQYVVIRLRAGVSNCLKICSKKKHFWNNSRCVAGPGCLSKLLPIEAPSLLGPPPSGQKYVEGCLWASPGLLLGCSWLRLGCSWLLLGCSWAAPGCSWVALAFSWAAPGLLLGWSWAAPGLLLAAPGFKAPLLSKCEPMHILL